MSAEEQDQILGRLVRESRESRRNLAALEAKLQGFRSQFAEVAKTFTGFMGPDALGPNGAISKASTAAKAIPERREILDTLEEVRLEYERLTELSSQLSKLE
jgi:hypothetical protein